MKKKDFRIKKRNLILLAVALSIILYGAGLLSGFSFSKFMEKNIEQKTQQDIAVIVDYVQSLDTDLQSLQIQELFVSTMNENATCKFADVYFSQINQNLNYFWKILPARLEEFEKNVKPTKDYLDLKQKYTTLSLRAWIISKTNYQKCNTSVIPVLYFYSTECDECVQQGEVLDNVKQSLATENKSLIVFTVDLNYEEAALDLVKKYYNIDKVPALILDERVLQGRLFSENEILSNLNKTIVK